MIILLSFFIFFFFNDTATTEIYTLSLHDALPISPFAFGFFARGAQQGLEPPTKSPATSDGFRHAGTSGSGSGAGGAGGGGEGGGGAGGAARPGKLRRPPQKVFPPPGVPASNQEGVSQREGFG